MLLELFIWSWVNLHPDHVRRQAIKFLIFSVLILLPLIVINLQIGSRGFTPALPSFIIEAGEPVPGNGDYPADDFSESL